MKKTNLRLCLATALTVCWLCVIWGNSLLPGEQSSQVSGWVGALLEKILPIIDMDADGAMWILRKLGHFSEFAVLGILLAWLCGMLEKPGALPVLGGIAAACVDETIQRFVPQRYGCLTDVLIDSAGVLTGVLLLYLLHKIRKTRCR